jgi:ribosomal protein S18 acetylase RimI-like enzyme
VHLRHTLRPGDLSAITSLHAFVYSREYGFDHTFEAYVAGPLAAFVATNPPRSRLWIAESSDQLAGCIAFGPASESEAQLRWFLVNPASRGRGLGRRLLTEAINFSRESQYSSIILWTVAALTSAARLYQAAGFTKVESNQTHLWGVDAIEEKYHLSL